MKANIIDIYYFSGTGNTYLAVQCLAEKLKEQGKEVNLYKLEKAKAQKIDLSHAIAIACPVAAFSTYPFVWDFVQNLPDTKGCEIFLLGTMAGMHGGLIGPMRRVLKQKGYKTIGAKIFKMPGNYLTVKPGVVNQVRIKKTLPQVENYAIALVKGKTRWGAVPFLSALVRKISKSPKSWVFMYKSILFDQEKCIRCGLCAKVCPVKAINYKKSALPKKTEACVSCMRCVSFCPEEAISLKKAKARYQVDVFKKDFIKGL